MNNELPLVSIIIPVYNQRPEFLRECLNSAINQTYKNIEIVISENHSTNETPNIIMEYATKDSRIKIVKPKFFLSMIRNFNFAFEKSTGSLVLFLSSDDILIDTCIEESIKPFIEYGEKVSFVYSRTSYLDNSMNSILSMVIERKQKYYKPSEALKLFISLREGSFGGTVFNRNVYQNIYLEILELNIVGDIFIFILALKFGGCYFVNKTLCKVRLWEREEQINRLPGMLKDTKYIYDFILNDDELMRIIDFDKGSVLKIRKRQFDRILYSLYDTFKSDKLSKETQNKTLYILKQEYNQSIMSTIVISCRYNLIGLLISKIYWKITNRRQNLYTLQ